MKSPRIAFHQGLLVIALLWLCTPSAFAQRYAAEPETEASVLIRSEVTSDASSLVVETRSGRRVLCSAQLPSVLFTEISADFDTRVLAGDDSVQYVSVTFTRGRVFATTHEIVFTVARDESACHVIWQSSYSSASAGERLISWSDDGGAPQSVALVVNSEAIAQCGPLRPLIQPRIYARDVGRFVARDWRITLRPDSPVVEPAASPVDDRFEDDGIIQYVSSDASLSMFTDPRAVPRAIDDGDVGTVWREGVEGAGRYSFVGGTTRGPVRIAGVRIASPPAAQGTGVSRWILRTDERDYVLASAGGDDETFLLPGEVDTGCFLLFADALRDGASTVLIGELTLLTELDLGPLDSSIDRVVQAFEDGDDGPWTRTAAVTVLGSGDRVVDEAMAQRLPQARFRERGILVEALASSESGREQLLRLIREQRLSERELERVGQVLRQRAVPVDFIIETLESSEPEAIRSLLSFLIESIPPQEVGRLLPWAGYPAPDSIIPPIDQSPDVGAGLGRGTVSLLGEYLDALDGRAGHDADILRGILLVSRREGAAQRSLALPALSTERLGRSLASENGTVVRLTLAVIGALRIPQLLGEVNRLALEDPHPQIRSAAISALRYFVEDEPGVRRAIEAGLTDPSPNVRMEAARVLRHVQVDETGVGLIGQRLEDERWPTIRQELLFALAAQNDAAAPIRLVQYLKIAPGREVRKAMIVVQNRDRKLPGSFLVDLYEAHASDERTQIAIVRSMANTRGAVASRFLQDLSMNDETPLAIRTAAIEALGRRRAIDGVAEMVLLLDAERAELRRAAARALAYFPDERVERALRRRLDTETVDAVQDALRSSLRAVLQGRALRDRTEGAAPPRERLFEPDRR